MSRFDGRTYPGARPAGPTLVYQGRTWPIDLSSDDLRVPDAATGARVLAGPVRWSLAYGANANVDRLVDKALDANGAILLPARARGWVTAWEARRVRSTGAVPLTVVPSPGALLDGWVLGLLPEDTATLDTSEGRGLDYVLGSIGPVAVAARWGLTACLAYGPSRTTRTLIVGSEVATYPALRQGDAARLLDRGGVDLAADALLDAVTGPWPETPLSDLPLFVYGTLQPGQRRWDAIDDLVEVVGPAVARGRLVSTFYGYPAASFDGGARIHGTLLRPIDAAAAAALYPHVDRIEDVPSLFRRVAVPVELVDGHDRGGAVWAASYAWNTDRGAAPGTPVEDGRWTS